MVKIKFSKVILNLTPWSTLKKKKTCSNRDQAKAIAYIHICICLKLLIPFFHDI